jgi:DNA-binding NtrC family response regulator
VDSVDKKRSQSDKTVLIVDGDASVRRVFSKILQGGGFIVDTAETGKEALDKIRDRAYDVTLIDVTLPDIKGMTILKAMEAASPDMTKIVIMGVPTAEDRTTTLEKGADAYLEKARALLRVIEKNLEKRKPC